MIITEKKLNGYCNTILSSISIVNMYSVLSVQGKDQGRSYFLHKIAIRADELIFSSHCFALKLSGTKV